MKTTSRSLLIFVLMLFWARLAVCESLWFSDNSPHVGHGGLKQAHGGAVEVRRGVYHKHLWLRQGEMPQSARFIRDEPPLTPLLLVDTHGGISEQRIIKDPQSGALKVDIAMPDEGFYNAYLIRQRVADGARQVEIAKAEVLKHSCREGHDHVQEKMPPRHNGDVPLEIVRERLPQENFHTLLGHGDGVTFQVLRQGRPQAGVIVTFTTAQGWSKAAVTDQDGRVSYTLIRDYYPLWHEFEKRHAQPYLVNAVYTLPEAGEVDGAPFQRSVFQSSYSGNYYPSPRDYESYAYGLSFGLFALLATGVGVYFYRRRRDRPYREVRFDG
jgi:hypothetical protein